MRFKTKIAIVVFSTIIAFYAIVGSFMSKSGQAVARGSQYAQLTIFDEVLGHIIRDYVDQPDLDKVRIGSLRGLAEGLDPYSAYLTPEQVKQYDPNADRGETGMVVSKVQGYAYVVSVIKGSPADQIGIRDGDFIEYVGKVPSRELSLYDTDELLSGQPGTVVSVRVLHRGQPRKVDITRARIVQPPIESRMEESGIGYIKITSLAQGKGAEVKGALKELIAKGAQKISLDLRGAASGNLDEGLAVANLFIGSGTLARIVGKNGRETQVYTADPSKVMFSGPLIAVIDRSTAGPGEIIAAAIRDQKRGELVGERSFGAGSQQQLFSLSDGGALLITTSKFAASTGKPFMDEPINPTVKVERPVVADVVLPGGDDDQDSSEGDQAQVTAPKPPEPPVEDIQLKKAIELLKQASAKTQTTGKRSAAGLRIPAQLGSTEDYRIST
jgi:carboxyl-terminal processing protease